MNWILKTHHFSIKLTQPAVLCQDSTCHGFTWRSRDCSPILHAIACASVQHASACSVKSIRCQPTLASLLTVCRTRDHERDHPRRIHQAELLSSNLGDKSPCFPVQSGSKTPIKRAGEKKRWEMMHIVYLFSTLQCKKTAAKQSCTAGAQVSHRVSRYTSVIFTW